MARKSTKIEQSPAAPSEPEATLGGGYTNEKALSQQAGQNGNC